MIFEICGMDINFDHLTEWQFLVGTQPLILFVSKKTELVLVSQKMKLFYETGNHIYSPSKGAAHGCYDRHCPVIHLPDIDPDHFHYFLEIIYGDTSVDDIQHLNERSICALISIAIRFSVGYIIRVALTYVTNETLIKFFGDNYVAGNTLVTRHIIYAIKNRAKFVFNYKCLKLVSTSGFVELIKVCAGSVTEEERLRMIKYYATQKHLIIYNEDGKEEITNTRVHFKGSVLRSSYYLRKILKLLNKKLLQNSVEFDSLYNSTIVHLKDIAEETDH